MKYRLVVFDSDGTLADTIPWMRSVFNELAEEFHFRRVEDHEFEEFRNLHGAELLKRLNLPLWKVPRVLNGMRKRMAQRIDSFTVFPGMHDVLDKLAAGGMKLGIVSSNSRANVERILGPQTAARVHYYACGASMFGKASHLRTVLRASKVSPADALYVGDEIRDAEAARDSGMAFGAVLWGQHSEAALRRQSPDVVFATPMDLAELVSPV